MPKNYRPRYPDNWEDIANAVKRSVNWKCSKCGLQCIAPDQDTSKLSRSEKMAITLTVHHRNYIPEDNRWDNLWAVCTACHLSYHTRRKGNVSPGQLSLF